MIDAATLKATFAGFTGEKMLRAWRNRSPVTCSYWTARARILLETDASPDAVWTLAAALYTACGEYVLTDETFQADTLEMVAWQGIACRVFDTTLATLHPGPTIVLAAPSGT